MGDLYMRAYHCPTAVANLKRKMEALQAEAGPVQGTVTVHNASKPMLKRLFTVGYEQGFIDGQELRRLIKRHGLEHS